MSGLDISFLTIGEKQLLAEIAMGRGYPILQKVLEEACRKATKEVLEADPSNEKLVIAKQQMARAAHKFCADVLITIEFERREAENRIDNPEDEEVSTGLIRPLSLGE